MQSAPTRKPTASTPSLKRAVYQLVPASKRERFIDLSEQITDSVGYYVIGQLTMGVINGVLSAIFLTIIQAPFPAVLAVIAFFFSLIPLVGTLGKPHVDVAALLAKNAQGALRGFLEELQKGKDPGKALRDILKGR